MSLFPRVHWSRLRTGCDQISFTSCAANEDNFIIKHLWYQFEWDIFFFLIFLHNVLCSLLSLSG